jgi:hypothetical protein
VAHRSAGDFSLLGKAVAKAADVSLTNSVQLVAARSPRHTGCCRCTVRVAAVRAHCCRLQRRVNRQATGYNPVGQPGTACHRAVRRDIAQSSVDDLTCPQQADDPSGRWSWTRSTSCASASRWSSPSPQGFDGSFSSSLVQDSFDGSELDELQGDANVSGKFTMVATWDSTTAHGRLDGHGEPYHRVGSERLRSPVTPDARAQGRAG